MLDEVLKHQLQVYMEKLVEPIELSASLDTRPASAELREFLEEIAALSDKIRLTEAESATRCPSFGIARTGEAPRIRFSGIPMGHEFTSLVLALLQASGYPPRLEDEEIAAAKALSGPYRFEIFVSLSCINCPDVVQALNTLAILNPAVETETIDGALFQEEVEARQIMGVPALYLNGESFGFGRMSFQEILARLDAGTVTREAEKISQKAPFDVLVVGGGPAGAAAAIYAARKGVRVGVVAERFGGQVLDTLTIENFISVKETEGPQLASALEEHVRFYGVEIMRMQRAEHLVPGERGAPIEIRLASGALLKSRTVILATGARWREMNVPGETQYRTKGVAYCPHCDGPLFKGKRVAVIGGGNSGVEAAIDLAGIVEHVTLLEYGHELRADAILQKKLASLANVTILRGAQTTEVHGDGQKVTGLTYKERATDESKHLDLAGIFVQIGLLPSTDWLKGSVELAPNGEIVTGARGETNVPGVFAAGDCTTVPYKQIIIAMGEGAKASLSAFDHLIRQGVKI
ncbi:MAG: alkyl hydroperoxide reductase subunit F [Zoogloeaceae bacterium]|jgi:alkyl hydroperoxide reductase subunit F|nr:alkyl hydroperoxide reductase subunit F [Zoogloeaceae bacterium]